MIIKKSLYTVFLVAFLSLSLTAPQVSAVNTTYDSIIVQPDSKGLIPVKKNGKWGFSDLNGKLKVSFKYNSVQGLSNGYTKVELNNKWGIADPDGKLVLYTLYDDVQYLSNGYFGIQRNNKWGIANTDGKIVFDILYDDVRYSGYGCFELLQNNKWDVYDINGITINSKYPVYDDYKQISSKYIAVGKKGEIPSISWGIIDSSTGKELIKPQYPTSVYGYNDPPVLINENGLFGMIQNFKKNIEDYDDIKAGIVDRNGKTVLPFKYQCYAHAPGIVAFMPYFSDGLSLVKEVDTGKISYIDRNGKIVFTLSISLPISFNLPLELQPFNFHDGMSKIISSGKVEESGDIAYTGKWGFIDKTGKIAVSMQYDKVSDYYNGYAAVVKNGKVGFIDKKGKIVVPIVYDYDKQISYPSNTYYDSSKKGMITVSKGGKYGVIDFSGKTIIPYSYDKPLVYNAENGLFQVNRAGKYGFINSSNKAVIAIKYQSVSKFKNNISFVESGYKYGAIDKSGKIVIPLQYSSISMLRDSRLLASKNGVNYILDTSGKQLFTTTEVILH